MGYLWNISQNAFTFRSLFLLSRSTTVLISCRSILISVNPTLAEMELNVMILEKTITALALMTMMERTALTSKITAKIILVKVSLCPSQIKKIIFLIATYFKVKLKTGIFQDKSGICPYKNNILTYDVSRWH